VVREINKPRYPTVPRRLAALDATIPIWDNKVMELDVNTIGLKGSPTQVNKIFSPEREKGEIIGDGANDPDGAVALLIEKLTGKDLLNV